VVDANGEPVADTAVYMSQPSYYDGPRKLAGGKSARTNDRGEYRVFWLEPGEYYPQTASRITTRTTGTIYYPGSADIGDARPITVQRGAVLTGIDFILPPPRDIPDFTISGRAVDSAGAGAAIGDFSLVRREGNGFREQYFQNLAADRSSGRFRLRGVEPGSYRLFPSNTDIQVVDSDIENITIRISPGVTVGGRMVIDGNRVDPDYLSGGVQVSLASIEGMPGILYQKIRGITPDNGRLDAATGEFRFIDVPPGRYNLRFAFALPNGAYFADVR
jgi:hypothetical protein